MWARGERAWGHCDRCGFRYLLKELRQEWSKLMVCPDCWDPKPQDFPPNVRARDPQALHNPRPDHDDIDPPAQQLKDVVPMTFNTPSD